MLRIITFCVFLFSFTIVRAAPEITVTSVPSYLHIYSATSGAYVDMPPTGCSGGRYVLDPGHPLFKEMFSILLSAQMSKKKVIVRFDGCNSGNQGKIIGVYLTE